MIWCWTALIPNVHLIWHLGHALDLPARGLSPFITHKTCCCLCWSITPILLSQSRTHGQKPLLESLELGFREVRRFGFSSTGGGWGRQALSVGETLKDPNGGEEKAGTREGRGAKIVETRDQTGRACALKGEGDGWGWVEGWGGGKEQGRISTAGGLVPALPTLHLMLLALAWLQPSQPRVEMGLGATSCSGQ